MNPLFERLMRSANRLTRSGNLLEATQAIQTALDAAGLGQPVPPVPAARDAGPAATDAVPVAVRAANDESVIDVEARVVTQPVAPADVPREASTEQWTDGVFAREHRQLAYKLFVPTRGAGTPRPLVLMLHGCTQDPEDFAAGTRMNELAREHGFLVLYPAQTQHANSSKCWNWFKTQHQQRGRGEPATLAALTRSVIEAQAVDPDRVYVAGLSAGGAMADILGRAYPDIFAAVGVHSGLPTGAANDLMSALSAMKQGPAGRGSGAGGSEVSSAGASRPTIVFHGDADSTVNARNGEALVAAALAGNDDAAGAAGAAQESGGRSPRGRAFTRRVHAGARGRPAVEHWLLHGAGHAWAGGSAQGSFTDPTGPDASAEMLRFFLANPKPSADGPLAR